MNDSSLQVLGADGEKLANLLDAGGSAADWRPEELGAIFQHQMTAPVQFDLAGFDPSFAARIKLLSGAQGLLVKSFRDLFQHAHPPLALLEAVKDFAKRAAVSREAILPKSIARVLYYLAIVTALLRSNKRITSLKNSELLRGLRWAVAQEWLDSETHAVLEDGVKRLEASRKEES